MEANGTRVQGDKLAMLRRMIAGSAPRPPVAELVGFELVEAEAERAVVELATGQRHFNPMGTVHGGILCDIADAAMGICFFAGLAPEESFTTLELKMNYLRPVWQTRLRAEARVVQRGRSVGLTECDVTDETGRLVARASSTLLVLRGEAAQGR